MIAGTATVAVAAAAGYFLLRPKPTPEAVKNPADVKYEQLCIRLNELEAQAQQPEANVDSLFQLLEGVEWGGEPASDYERQKFNLYLDQKKNVAMTFRKVVQERGLELASPHLDNVESISE